MNIRINEILREEPALIHIQGGIIEGELHNSIRTYILNYWLYVINGGYNVRVNYNLGIRHQTTFLLNKQCKY
jgi:hypothetical protein